MADDDVQPEVPAIPEVSKGHKRGRTKKGEAQSQNKSAIEKRLERVKRRQSAEFDLLSPEERQKRRLAAQEELWEANRQALTPQQEEKFNEQVQKYNDVCFFLERSTELMRTNQTEEGFSIPEAFVFVEEHRKTHPLREDSYTFTDTLTDFPPVKAEAFSSQERKLGLPVNTPYFLYRDFIDEFSRWLFIHHNELRSASEEVWEAVDKLIADSKNASLRNWSLGRNETKSTPTPVVPPKLQKFVAQDGYEEHLSPDSAEAAYYATHTFRSPAEQRAHNAIQKAVHQDNPNVVKQVQQLNPAQRPNESQTLPQAMQKPVAKPIPQQPEDPTTALLKQLLFLKLIEHSRDKA